MPGRQIILADEQYYHVFNRGVAKLPIFLSEKDYSQALLTLTYYLFCFPPKKLSRYKELPIKERDKLILEQQRQHKLLVELVAFTFMPNHIHFLVRQVFPHGTSKFMSQFQNSYTRYFNTKHNRVGPLFQGAFKAVLVESEEQLLHLTRYIHLNPVVSNVITKEALDSYPWTSYQDYVKPRSQFVSTDIVFSRFKTSEQYKQFVMDHVDYAQRLHDLKHVLLEEP